MQFECQCLIIWQLLAVKVHQRLESIVGQFPTQIGILVIANRMSGFQVICWAGQAVGTYLFDG